MSSTISHGDPIARPIRMPAAVARWLQITIVMLMPVVLIRLFFAPGTWTFNASDALIRLVPEKFWFDTALSPAGLSLVGGMVVALIGWLWVKRLRRI